VSSVHAAPLLPVLPVGLGLLVGLLLGLVAWGFLQTQTHEDGDFTLEAQDNLILALLVLAAFALGAFLAYVMLSVRL
jgi:NhaP-type Na+/H+ or K+/H+ antiporter